MTCIRDYLKLLADLDAEIARLSERHAAALSCGPGCSSCCLAFSVLAIEAACLQKALAALPAADLAQLGRNLAAGNDRCPLLIENLCRVYPARPVICRTQGLPLAYVDEERQVIEVSACPRNFPEDHAFAPEDLLFLDGFNGRLAELNLVWCREKGLAPGSRIPLRELAGFTPPER